MILDSAESLESLAGLPTNRFEALKGDIRINDQLVVLSLMKYKSKLSQTRQGRDPSGRAAQASKTLKSLEPRA